MEKIKEEKEKIEERRVTWRRFRKRKRNGEREENFDYYMKLNGELKSANQGVTYVRNCTCNATRGGGSRKKGEKK